jgi:two-component system, response regulator PdtaR
MAHEEERRSAAPDGLEGLEGKRILIVEDEFFLALLIEEEVRSFGCEAIGPYTTLEQALQAARQERCDAAILDINLDGKMAYPVADELLARGIPFMFVTGYIGSDLPQRYRDRSRLEKPVDPKHLKEMLERLVGVAAGQEHFH